MKLFDRAKNIYESTPVNARRAFIGGTGLKTVVSGATLYAITQFGIAPDDFVRC